jgi:hypothetical protein
VVRSTYPSLIRQVAAVCLAPPARRHLGLVIVRRDSGFAPARSAFTVKTRIGQQDTRPPVCFWIIAVLPSGGARSAADLFVELI